MKKRKAKSQFKAIETNEYNEIWMVNRTKLITTVQCGSTCVINWKKGQTNDMIEWRN